MVRLKFAGPLTDCLWLDKEGHLHIVLDATSIHTMLHMTYPMPSY